MSDTQSIQAPIFLFKGLTVCIRLARLDSEWHLWTVELSRFALIPYLLPSVHLLAFLLVTFLLPPPHPSPPNLSQLPSFITVLLSFHFSAPPPQTCNSHLSDQAANRARTCTRSFVYGASGFLVVVAVLPRLCHHFFLSSVLI